MFKKKYKNDIILITVILLLALITFVIFRLNLKDGNYVSVSVDGERKYTYKLNGSIKTVITTSSGENTLVIENNQAFIESATCPDKICVAHRKISKTGETIVCLPHKLVVEIVKE